MIGYLWSLDGWPDYFRYAVALEGALLVGVDLALIAKAPNLFSRFPTFWRWAIFGKMLITWTLALALLDQSGNISWRPLGAAIGFTVTLVSIAALYTHRFVNGIDK